MRAVKMFSETSVGDLEWDVNEFLQNNPECVVLDIQFTLGKGDFTTYGAMIFYQKQILGNSEVQDGEVKS